MNDYERIARSLLSGPRLTHSLNTAKEAALLAHIYGADEQKAYNAGMVHDIAKSVPKSCILRLAADYGFVPDDIMAQNTGLIHGPLAAAMLARDYGETDAELLHAVAVHTTGCAGMSLTDKLLYTADLTEPGREYAGIDEIRETSRSDIDDAVLMTLKYVMRFVLDRGMVLHPDSVAAYNQLTIQRGGR